MTVTTYRPRRVMSGGALLATLAVLALLAAPSLGFKSGTYSGTSSQGQPLQLKVNKRKTKVNIVFFEFEGPGCAPGTQIAGQKTAVRASGKFKWVDPFDFLGFVKGEFQHNEADGTARLGGGPCDSGPITWSAERTGP